MVVETRWFMAVERTFDRAREVALPELRSWAFCRNLEKRQFERRKTLTFGRGAGAIGLKRINDRGRGPPLISFGVPPGQESHGSCVGSDETTAPVRGCSSARCR